jgi:hypothetical protein
MNFPAPGSLESVVKEGLGEEKEKYSQNCSSYAGPFQQALIWTKPSTMNARAEEEHIDTAKDRRRFYGIHDQAF